MALGLLTRMQSDLSRKDRAISCLARKLEVEARESEKRRDEIQELSSAFARARDVRRVIEEREAAEREIKALKGKVKNVEELVGTPDLCLFWGSGPDNPKEWTKAFTVTSTGMDRDRGGDSGRWARVRRDILSLCLSRHEPRVPIHLLCPDPPRLTQYHW